MFFLLLLQNSGISFLSIQAVHAAFCLVVKYSVFQNSRPSLEPSQLTEGGLSTGLGLSLEFHGAVPEQPGAFSAPPGRGLPWEPRAPGGRGSERPAPHGLSPLAPRTHGVLLPAAFPTIPRGAAALGPASPASDGSGAEPSPRRPFGRRPESLERHPLRGSRAPGFGRFRPAHFALRQVPQSLVGNGCRPAGGAEGPARPGRRAAGGESGVWEPEFRTGGGSSLNWKPVGLLAAGARRGRGRRPGRGSW